MRAELPGVLAWIVRGCLEYQRDGLGEPDQVKDATERYKTAMDALAAFFAEQCVIHEDATAPATPLYKAYQEWCADNGEASESQRRFGERLRERGHKGFTYTSGAHKDRKGWKGIGLRDDRPDDGDDGGPGDGEDPPDPSEDKGPLTRGRADVQSGTNNNKQRQDAYNSAETPDKGPLSGQSADLCPPGVSGLGKRENHEGVVHSGPCGPFFNIGSFETSREASIPEKGPQGPQGPLSGGSGSWFGGTAEAKREYKSVAELLHDPPQWLAEQLARCREDDHLYRPTAAAMSAALYDTPERADELLPVLDAYLKPDPDRADGVVHHPDDCSCWLCS